MMSRHEEMLGLYEYLSHPAKCLLLASQEGHRTIGVEYGKAAAGSFLATELAAETLIGLPGAEPAVMDLPSMARVTKLPLDRLTELAKTTPVFAPGLDHMAQTGAVASIWDPKQPWDQHPEEATARRPFWARSSGTAGDEPLPAGRSPCKATGRRPCSALAREAPARRPPAAFKACRGVGLPALRLGRR